MPHIRVTLEDRAAVLCRIIERLGFNPISEPNALPTPPSGRYH
jgi:hypothetical protein